MAREHRTKSDSYLVTWTVEPGEAGTRLDLFLKEKYRRLSREYLQRAVKDGSVTLNHKPSKPSQLLKVRDKVYVMSTNSGAEPPVNLNYKVVFEDEQILVIEKPGNLPVHPTGRYFFHTLLTQLRVENGNEVDQEKEFYLVHRIDRETSGLLVVAKNPEAAADLTLQWEKKGVEKAYLAIVKGRVEQDSFVVDAPLGSCPHSQIKLKMGVVEMGANGEPLYLPKSEILPSRTAVEVVERVGNYTVVRCIPHTGRQHQIRVHLHHVGHPIVGDKLYGPGDDFFLRTMKETMNVEVESGIELSRHALHAHKLAFRNPTTGEMMEFTSPLPAELDEFLQKVRR